MRKCSTSIAAGFANVLVIIPTHVMITAATYDDGGGGDDDDWDDLSSGLGVQN